MSCCLTVLIKIMYLTFAACLLRHAASMWPFFLQKLHSALRKRHLSVVWFLLLQSRMVCSPFAWLAAFSDVQSEKAGGLCMLT